MSEVEREDDAMERSTVRSEEEILTSREACALLKIGRTKLWELTRANLFPAYRVGNGSKSELRYKRSELLAWLEQNRV
jgi:excisionase family DNA binding protein